MSLLDAKIRKRLERSLHLGDATTKFCRLVEDADRLCGRVKSFIDLQLVRGEPDMEGIELAAFALQLPLRPTKHTTAAKLARVSLRDRAEQGAEILPSEMGDAEDETLIERATRILRDVHRKQPLVDEARLLADAVNLDDFGATGAIIQSMQLARQDGGVHQFTVALEKRDEYGYWDARLKDGFHFDQVRSIAKKRLENARRLCQMLRAEVEEPA